MAHIIHDSQAPKPTNADCIRVLSDEELAEKFVDMSHDTDSCGKAYWRVGGMTYRDKERAIAVMLAILRQPAKED